MTVIEELPPHRLSVSHVERYRLMDDGEIQISESWAGEPFGIWREVEGWRGTEDWETLKANSAYLKIHNSL